MDRISEKHFQLKLESLCIYHIVAVISRAFVKLFGAILKGNNNIVSLISGQMQLPSAFVLSRQILNKIPALEVGDMISGKKLELGLPSVCPV